MIRTLTTGDHGAWRPLWRAYQAFDRVEIPDAVSAVTWARLLDPDEPMGGAPAGEGDEAVGLVHHVRHRSTWTVGDDCHLQDLFVTPEGRGGGTGRALIAHVEAAAQTAGCARVHWLTHHTNTEAMLLYDRGAERSGLVQHRHNLG